VTIAAAAPAAPSGGTTTTITTTTTPTKSTTPTKTTTPPKANSASVSGYAASAAPAATSVRLTAGGAAKAWKPGQRIAVRVGATVVHPTAAQVRSLGRRGVVRLAAKGKRGRTRTLVLRVRRRHGRRYVSARLAG
jgi:hypothetical protein